MKKMYFLAGLLSVQLAFAQNNENFKFEEVTGHGLPAFYGGSIADGVVSGKKAVLITGMINNKPTTELYEYNGSAFVKNSSTFTGVRGGQGIFLDIDKDGDQDIAIIGLGDNGTRHFLIYENKDGNFTLKQDLSTNNGLSNASIDAGDYNKDGYPDVIVTGQKTDFITSRQTYLFANNNGNLELKTASFTNVTDAAAKFIDLKGDGNLGVVLSGKKGDNDGIIEIYAEDNGTFKKVKDYSNEEYGFENVDVVVGKINSDNYEDFIPIGKGYWGESYVFYGKDGVDFTVKSGIAGFLGSNSKNTVVLKDFNKDNLLDLVILGEAEGENIHYYNNDNNNTFTKVEGQNIDFGQDGSIVALDFNGDGRMDLIVSGKNSYGISNIKVYKNTNTSLSNKETNVANNINIYPNPTSDSFKIQGNENIAQVEVYEVSGRLVKTFVSSEQYNIASLAKGTYIVVAKDKQGKKSTFKLLKK